MSRGDSNPDAFQEQVDAAIAHYLAAVDSGRPLDREDWLARYPDLRPELERFLRDEADLFGRASPTGSARSLDETTDFATSASRSPNAIQRGVESTNLPESVGPYRLIRHLGSGGMGDVYEAEDESGHRVAIKLLSTAMMQSQDSMLRFKQEGAIASAINHPRCVFVKAADEWNGVPYITMELMTGKTLKDLVQDGRPLPVKIAVEKILDVVEGLEEAHQHGMIHRDIKPANCYLEPSGRVKLGDFGLARSITDDSELTKTGAFVGTPLYASPEQIRGRELDGRTDIYSVCATLYYLLTGQAPFANSSAALVIAQIVSEDPIPPSRLNPSIPPELENVLLKGLSRNPQLRWQSASELADHLRPFLLSGRELAGPSRRAAAYGIDFVLLAIVGAIGSVIWISSVEKVGVPPFRQYLLGNVVPLFLYSFLMEGIWGGTLGKLATGLRVVTRGSNQRAGWGRIAIRALVYMLLTGVATDLIWYAAIDPSSLTLFAAAQFTGYFVCSAIMLSTALIFRRWVLVHDLLSGTEVIDVGVVKRQDPLAGRRCSWTLPFAEDDRLPEMLGAFRVRGLIRGSPDNGWVLAEDEQLDRSVWIWLRNDGASAAIEQARMECDRKTRLRWVNGGVAKGQRWDAFLAFDGSPLSMWHCDEKPMGWRVAAPILLQLGRELIAGKLDGTEAHVEGVDQVWLNQRGQVCLLDTFWRWQVAPSTVGKFDESSEKPAEGVKGDRAWTQTMICREVARWLLEGRMDDIGGPASSPASTRDASTIDPTYSAGRPEPISAIVPLRARKLLDELTQSDGPEELPQDFVPRLVDCTRHEAEVTAISRLITVGLSAVTMGFLFLMMIVVARMGNMFVLIQTQKLMMLNEAVQRLSEREDWWQALEADSGGKLEGLSREEILDRVRTNRRLLAEEYARTWGLASDFQRLSLEVNGEVADPTERLRQLEFEFIDDDPWVIQTSGWTVYARDWDWTGEEIGDFICASPIRDVMRDAGRKARTPLWFTSIPILVIAVWAGLTRGGIPMWVSGFRLVNRRGRPVRWWVYLLRSLLIWLPYMLLLVMLNYLDVYHRDWPTGIRILSHLVIYLPGLYALMALLMPRRGPQDWLMGTTLVPR